MKRNKIVNVSGVKLEFFVKVEGAEDQLISLEPGAVCFSDGEEFTKSMRIFHRKNLLNIESGEFPIAFGFSETLIVDLSKTNSSMTHDATPNSDEVLDDLHTTKNIEIKIKDAESLQRDLEKYHNISSDQFKDMMKDIAANEIRMDLFNDLTQSLSSEEPTVSVDWAMENILGISKEEYEKLKSEDELKKIADNTNATIDQNDAIKDVFDINATTENNILKEAEDQAKEYKEEESEKKQYKYNYKKKPGRKKKRGPKPGSKKKKLDEDSNKNNENNE